MRKRLTKFAIGDVVITSYPGIEEVHLNKIIDISNGTYYKFTCLKCIKTKHKCPRDRLWSKIFEEFDNISYTPDPIELNQLKAEIL